MPYAGSRRTPTASSSPSPAGDQALQLSLERILQDVLVVTEISDQRLELPVLLLELLQPTHLSHAHPGKLLLPSIEHLLADTHLPADIPDGCAVLGLPQRERDLLLRESRLLHGFDLLTEAGLSQNPSLYEWTKKRV